jgi:ADP-ribosylglycohydrolase
MNKDKINGLFLGCFIGDCLGAPVESFSQKEIQEKYGRLTTFVKPEYHKWFKNQQACTPTDDWQLSKAVAEALLDRYPLNLDNQARYHVEAMKESTSGWGRSTSESVMRLSKGASWKLSGQKMGVGNGVAMKIAPVGALAATQRHIPQKYDSFAIKLAQMTHKTSLACSSALVHMLAVRDCFWTNKLNTGLFIKNVCDNAKFVEENCKKFKGDTITDKLSDRLVELSNHKEYDTERIVKDFGAGSCYVYNSLPFTYMFFVKNPHSIESLYDVINAGGDTDTNGSILGAMLGALNGTKIFPQELIESIPKEYYDEVMDLANRFADKFKFE